MAKDEVLRAAAQRVEDVHQLRLMSVLQGMVHELGTRAAAEALEVDIRTLEGCRERGVLSRRVQQALERRLVAGDGAELVAHRERLGDLEARVAALETGAGPTEGQPFGAARPRRRGRSSGKGETAGGPRAEDTGDGPDPERRQEPSPGVVTLEPVDDEAAVYGAAAPLIAEWRRRMGDRGAGDRIARARNRTRVLELELVLLGDHGLTLPPAREPLHTAERAGELAWRRRALVTVHRERLRREALRWARRVVTLGLWWR